MESNGNLSFENMLKYHEDCNPGGFFYHYTSVEALESILGGMQLRLTRYDLMTKGEDEGNEAVRVAVEILEDLEKGGLVSQQLFEKIVNTIHSGVKESFTHCFGSQTRVPCVPYVICFTHIDSDEKGDAEWISNRDLRIETRVDNDLLEIFAVSRRGYIGLSNHNGFHVFRWIDYGKKSIRKTIEWQIREQLRHCRDNGESEEFICTSIRDIVNEERMFLHSEKFRYQKEVRFVVYVPLDHDAVPGFDEVVKSRRVMGTSNNLEYLSPDPDGAYIYLNLKIPLGSFRVTVLSADDDTINRVEAALNGAARDGFIKTPLVNLRSNSKMMVEDPATYLNNQVQAR